jgi:hypothetical protein
MMKLVAVSILFASGACTTEAPTPVLHTIKPIASFPQNEPVLVTRGDARLQEQTDEDDICDHLPTTGACSVACDPEAFAQYMPKGVCVLVVCQLDDGRTVNLGGCY